MLAAFVISAATAGNATAPVWPNQFHAVLLQNRSGDLAMVDLYYDYLNGRNYNLIRPQMDAADTLYDLEYANGSTYYYFPEQEKCSVLQMGVGLLSPTWLGDSGQYVGVRQVDDFICDVWNASDGFLLYYADQKTRLPVYWRFGSGAEFHVMSFEEGVPSTPIDVPIQCKPGPPATMSSFNFTSLASVFGQAARGIGLLP
jgi:hypothetical protein